MKLIDLTKHKFIDNRDGVRKELINLFLDEDPGTGKGDLTARYKYVVNKVGIHEIYLSRPAQFNNGFDFTLNVSNLNFNPAGRKTNRPTHENILEDLRIKKKANSPLYRELKNQIDNIYICQNVAKTNFDFKIGLDSDILLECIKWLFVEQDVTYWNYSGRAMFYNAINNI